MNELKAIIKDIWNNYGIDISYYVSIGLLHIADAKNWLIINEYPRLYNNGELSHKEVKERLSKRYGISISSIEKMVYRNNKV